MGFAYRDKVLYVEDVALENIATSVGTPSYVYSQALLKANWQAYVEGFGARRHRICYALKANATLAIVDLLRREGASFDIVSGGELARVLATGAAPANVVFSGVGKLDHEIEQALAVGVGCINCESRAELDRIAVLAQQCGRPAAVALRVNPDVDAGTHPYISTGLRENKFGVEMSTAQELYRLAQRSPWLNPIGIACHIGSQMTSLAPLEEALGKVVGLAKVLRDVGCPIQHIDVGGGLGICYRDETPPTIAEYTRAICTAVPEEFEIVCEPGRSIVGPAGILLARVVLVKQTTTKRFAVCDAAMSELLRPALYDAWHDVHPLREQAQASQQPLDIVGPVCESADFLATSRPLDLRAGDIIAIADAGAYGMVMASNYNARPRPAEVMVAAADFTLIRQRETVADLYRLETCLPVVH